MKGSRVRLSRPFLALCLLLQTGIIINVGGESFSKLQPLVVPSQFCNRLPSGRFCNVNFPREIISCPSSTSTLCPLNQICVDDILPNGTYTATCGASHSSDAIRACKKSITGQMTSLCLNDNQVVECPGATIYSCPPDLLCQKRGLRAYCVQPAFQNVSLTPLQSCAGIKSNQNLTICDAINLRRIVNCPSGNSTICPTGTLCSSASTNFESSCLPWLSDLDRFCSNKPLFTTYCLPNDTERRLVICGNKPTIVRCPSNTRCNQYLSITAQCE